MQAFYPTLKNGGYWGLNHKQVRGHLMRHKSCFSIKSIDETGRIAGYASVFGVVDRQRDVMMPGAFLDHLQKPLSDIKLLWQHQWQEPIGVITQCFEDANGLYVEAQLLLDVARAKEAYSLLREGAINGLSIGYAPISYQIDPDTGVRKLKQVELFEISLVTIPANPHAVISVVKQATPDHLKAAHHDISPQELGALLAALDGANQALLSE
jgi:HK97 family phage prohead protease